MQNKSVVKTTTKLKSALCASMSKPCTRSSRVHAQIAENVQKLDSTGTKVLKDKSKVECFKFNEFGHNAVKSPKQEDQL